VGDSAPFELRARAAMPVASDLPLKASRRDGDWLRASYIGRRTPVRTRTALLELSSVLGQVNIEIQPRTPAPELR
jgi:hypothetical protein